MAGFENIPIAYADTVKKYGLKVKIDLTGRFASNIEAYQWAFDEYWDDMDHTTVAWFVSMPSHSQLRDYLVANKIFTFWVTGEKDGNPANSDSAAERAWVTDLLVNKIPTSIPVIGFPGAEPGEGIGEVDGVFIMSRAGKFHICNNWRPNLTVWSGLECRKKQYESMPPRKLQLEDDKVYVSLIISDGDNMNPLFNWFPDYWRAPQHGKFAVGWTMGPGVIDMQAPLLDFYFDNIQLTDSIGCSVTGLGYIYLQYYGLDFEPQYRKRLWDEYQILTERYMRKLGEKWVHVFRKSSIEDIPLDKLAAIPSVDTIMCDYWGGTPYEQCNYMVDDTVVFHALRQGASYIDQRLESITKEIPDTRPAFAHLFFINWRWTYADLEKLVNLLPEDFVVVRPEQLGQLYRDWKNNNKQ